MYTRVAQLYGRIVATEVDQHLFLDVSVSKRIKKRPGSRRNEKLFEQHCRLCIVRKFKATWVVLEKLRKTFWMTWHYRFMGVLIRCFLVACIVDSMVEYVAPRDGCVS